MKEKNRVVVLVAGSAMQLFLGIIYIWSVFVGPVSEYFGGWDPAAVKLTSSFMLCFFVVGILIGGKLQVKITTQKTVLFGGILLSLAMFSSAILPANLKELIYFTYGILGGFGVGMGYNAIISTAQRHFPDKRGLATGISVCTFGFSTVIFAPLVQALEASIGLQSTFLMLGVTFLIATIICFSFIAMPSQASAAGSANLVQKDFETKDMLKDKRFYMITVSMMFGTSVYFILNPSFTSLALERGLTAEMATLMIMLTGISNALGRLVFPMISDKTNRSFACLLTIAITAISAFLLIFAQGYFLMVIVILSAFCYGGISGTFPLITGKVFGLKNIGSNYGCVMIGFAVSALLFPIILNFVTDEILKFVILGAVGVVGSILLFPLFIKESKK